MSLALLVPTMGYSSIAGLFARALRTGADSAAQVMSEFAGGAARLSDQQFQTHLDVIARRLNVQQGDLKRAIEELRVPGSGPDARMKRSVLAFLDSDSGNVSPDEFFGRLGDISVLAGRYAGRNASGEAFIICPGCLPAGDGAGSATLKAIEDASVAEAARRLPLGQTARIEDQLKRGLGRFGLEVSDRELAALDPGMADAWALVVEVSRRGGNVKRLADSMLGAIGAGSSKSFFDESNTNKFYRLISDDWRDSADLDTWVALFDDVAAERAKFPSDTLEDVFNRVVRRKGVANQTAIRLAEEGDVISLDAAAVAMRTEGIGPARGALPLSVIDEADPADLRFVDNTMDDLNERACFF